jgi:hypothetical protein
VVKKYTKILRKTLFYRRWAEDLEGMVDNPDRVNSDPRLAAKVGLPPKADFFVEYNYPPNTLIRLLEAQPDNKRALEYLLAGFLLGKNLEGVVGSIQGLSAAGYTRIPRHVEEAALMLLGSLEEPVGIEKQDAGEIRRHPLVLLPVQVAGASLWLRKGSGKPPSTHSRCVDL